MTKKEILDLIEKNIAPRNVQELKIFSDDKKNSDKNQEKTGNNQYRSLANACLRAECCEEIEILIQYKEAKNTKGESWSRSYKGKTLAKVVLDCVAVVKKSTDGNRECLKTLSLFFGYLYWYSRVWSAECAAKEVGK